MDAPGHALTVSVAVLNHRRPDLLRRVLTAITQLEYPAFEIVVVGDQPDLGSYALPQTLATQVRYVPFTEPNICRARNLAIQASGGEIVAFIDDDAAPEPSWLTELVKPFEDSGVATVGGTVRGSDGVTIEWQGGVFDRNGQETRIALDRDITTRTAKAQTETGGFLALRGVNAAFRRKALIQACGFDEAIRYFLDETDMALRLADAGWSAAFARRAEVHHLLVPNASRGLRRKPGNQHEIGAGKAVFCKKHAPGDLEATLSAFRRQRLAMLDPQMRLGIVRTKDRARVEQELEAGIQDGLSRVSTHGLLPSDIMPGFRRFERIRTHQIFNIAIDTGWQPQTNTALRSFARNLADAGHRVSIFSFRSGPEPLQVSFKDGVWRHSGGTWRLPAMQSEIPAIGRHARAHAERARIAGVRDFDVIVSDQNGPANGPTIELPGCRRKLTILAGQTGQAELSRFASELQSLAEAGTSAPTVAAMTERKDQNGLRQGTTAT